MDDYSSKGSVAWQSRAGAGKTTDDAMRVVIVGPFPREWETFQGGVESHIAYLAKYMPRVAPMDVHIVTLADKSEQGVVPHDGLTIYYEPSARLDTWCFWLRNRRRMARRIASLGPDIVHAHVAGPYAMAAFQSGCPAVLTPHGIRYREALFYRGLRHVVRGKLIGMIERMSVRRARHVISPSPYVEDTFGDLVRGRLYSIEYLVDEEFFQVSGQGRPNRVLFVGIVTPRKGVMELLQAVKQVRRSMPGLELRIAGQQRVETNSTYFDRLQDYVNANGLADAVRFLGQVDREGILEELEHCQILVLPSFQETTPMAIIEAMAARRAVVATRVGGVPRMISDGQTGLLVDPGDVGGLAQALTRLLKDPELRDRLAEQAAAEAMKRFHPAAIARQTVAVYREVLKAEE